MPILESPILEILKEEVHFYPQEASAWEQLGDLYAEQDNINDAIFCYRKVLEINPEDIEVQINLERLDGTRTSATEKDTEVEKFVNPLVWFSIEIPLLYQILIGLICFLITLIMASVQQWVVTDLVWSLWITSLTLGYTYLLSNIVVNGIQQGLEQSENVLIDRLLFSQNTHLRWVIAIIGALFILIFFSLHFGMFHFIHAIFLNSFFPLLSATPDGIPNVFALIQTSLLRYWPVILLSLFAQIRNFQKLTQNAGQQLMFSPYKNVIKMHFSIILFGALSMFGLNDFFMPYLLILYFFPFIAVFDYISKRYPKQAVDVV